MMIEISGLVVALLGFIWAIYSYFKPPREKTRSVQSNLTSEQEVRNWLYEQNTTRLKHAIQKNFTGNELHCDGYIRRYYDKQWDLIITNNGEYYWRNKKDHITYKCDANDSGTFLRDGIGEEVDMFNDDAEDVIWDESPEEDNYNENKDVKKKDDIASP